VIQNKNVNQDATIVIFNRCGATGTGSFFGTIAKFTRLKYSQKKVPVPKALRLAKQMSGIYIHIPYCKSKCHYCDFYSVTDLTSIPQFLNALEAEIANSAKKNTRKSKIYCIYFGGGTPSALPNGAITRIINDIKNNFEICENAEITVEANPDSVTQNFINECVANDVNRISLGIQSHCDNILKQIGRLHSFHDVKKAIDLVNKSGINNISVDAILGLPNQTKQSVLDTLNLLTAFKNVKHISLYALTIEKGTQLFKDNTQIDQDFQAELYKLCVTYLEQKGFLRYEVSNFAKAGFESRHNQKYWTGENYFGFGAGAHSLINGIRYENAKDLSDYTKNPLSQKSHTLTKNEQIEEFIMLGLRTSNGIDTQKLKEKLDYDILTIKYKQLNELEKGGFLAITNGNITLKSHVYYLLDAIVFKII